MKIVLFEPEIPQNTGNVVRTCSVTGCGLILVEPLGFSIANRHLRRSGLDYWEGVDVETTDDLENLIDNCSGSFYFFSSRAEKIYTNVSYSHDDLLIFGSETRGLPEKFWRRWPERFVKIPMLPGARCLNLATSVGVAVYEALRSLAPPSFIVR